MPECGHAPGQEDLYAAAGVERFLVDSPALHGDTAAARPVGAGPLLCFGRDLEVTYRVWSPRAGYPGAPDYRDFHTFDHASGFRPARVTGRHVPPERKKPWEPDLAAAAVRRDAADFVDTVLARLRLLADRDGRPGLVVAAFDTELFGHWWHEGPAWLATVLRELPAAGVRVTTLRGAAAAGHVGPPVTLGRSSWGSGKDWRVWEGPAVQDLVLAAKGVQDRLLSTLDAHRGPVRDPVLDQLAREALLALSSDWAFMVSHETAAGYARDRAATHAGRVHELADRLDAGDRAGAAALADRLRAVDGPFGHLDARRVLEDPAAALVLAVGALVVLGLRGPARLAAGPLVNAADGPPGPPGLQVDPGRRAEQHDHHRDPEPEELHVAPPRCAVTGAYGAGLTAEIVRTIA